MWDQVIVVKKTYVEHCGVDAHTEEEDPNKTDHLQMKKKKLKSLQLTS